MPSPRAWLLASFALALGLGLASGGVQEKASTVRREPVAGSVSVLFGEGGNIGVSIGEDGASQMALEDLAMMRALLDTTVLYPCDAVSAERLVETVGAAWARLRAGVPAYGVMQLLGA